MHWLCHKYACPQSVADGQEVITMFDDRLCRAVAVCWTHMLNLSSVTAALCCYQQCLRRSGQSHPWQCCRGTWASIDVLFAATFVAGTGVLNIFFSSPWQALLAVTPGYGQAHTVTGSAWLTDIQHKLMALLGHALLIVMCPEKRDLGEFCCFPRIYRSPRHNFNS